MRGREGVGTIAAVSGHPGSGLWEIRFRDGRTALVESGFGMRQLARAAEDLGRRGIAGMRIRYRTDRLGVLEAFSPEGEREG